MQLALHILLLTILQLYHLSPPLPTSVSNSSCLFTLCQPLYVSYWTILLYFSGYCTVRLKRFLCLFFMYSVQFSRSVVSDSLRPHGLQPARLPCLSPTPGACGNSCPLCWRCHPTTSLSVIPFLLLQPSLFPSIRVFSKESVLLIRWPKYWSFSYSISPSNEYSGLISFRMDLDLLAVQGTLKSLPQQHSSKASILWHLAFLIVPTLTSIHDHWKNHSLD